MTGGIKFVLMIDNLCSHCQLFCFSPPSSRFCDQPLLNITVAGIVFTFAMIGRQCCTHVFFIERVGPHNPFSCIFSLAVLEFQKTT